MTRTMVPSDIRPVTQEGALRVILFMEEIVYLLCTDISKAFGSPPKDGSVNLFPVNGTTDAHEKIKAAEQTCVCCILRTGRWARQGVGSGTDQGHAEAGGSDKSVTRAMGTDRGRHSLPSPT